jgi:hypothetical protein
MSSRRKGEMQDLSQMMLWIVQNNRELARSDAVVTPPNRTSGLPVDSGYGEAARRLSSPDRQSIYIVDQPVDMRSLSISSSNNEQNGHALETADPYMYIPPNPRAYYKLVAKEALRTDLRTELPPPSEESSLDVPPSRLLSKQSVELLNELGARWRVPYSSRLVLILDIVRDLFQEREIDLDVVDAAFTFFKEPPPDKKKIDMSLVLDRTRWTLRDFVLNQQILAAVHDILLRDLFEQLQSCYDTKPPDISVIMDILETRIYEDPYFSKTPEDLDTFSDHLQASLMAKAKETYHGIFTKELGQLQEQAVFSDVTKLGKAVMKLVERIRRRYSRTPQIMGYV